MSQSKRDRLYALLDLALSTRSVTDITKMHDPNDPKIDSYEQTYKDALGEAVDMISEAI